MRELLLSLMFNPWFVVSDWAAPFSVLAERSSVFDDLFFAAFLSSFAIGSIFKNEFVK